jgi:hypothetical protein
MSTRLRAVVGIAVVLGAFTAATALHAQGKDPAAGTWTLNVSKSKSSPAPVAKSGTFTVAVTPQGRKNTTDGVSATGAKTHSEYAAAFDGKDYPIKGDPSMDTIALTLVDQYTYDRTAKKAGKVVQTMHIVVAKDGKSLTIDAKGTDAQGRPSTSFSVYDKQ